MTTNVVTIDEAESVRKALQLMAQHDIGALVVTSKGNPIGIVTERDIVRRMAKEELKLEEGVGKIMSQPLISIESTTSLTKALQLMVDEGIRRLPVVEGGRLVGIIVERDIIRWLAERPDVILDLLSSTRPEVVKEALVALLRELKLRERI